MLGFFKKNKPGSAYTGPPIDVDWVRNSRGKFHRLLHLDTTSEGLKGLSGVYVIWHSGVKPGWVYVGRADNLASALDAAQDNEDIDEYEINGGLLSSPAPRRRTTPKWRPQVPARYDETESQQSSSRIDQGWADQRDDSKTKRVTFV